MLDRSLFEILIAEASLAPSVHNIQPTRWRLLSGDTILLLEDGQRRLPAADPSGYDVRPVSYTHLDVYKRQAQCQSPCGWSQPNAPVCRPLTQADGIPAARWCGEGNWG